MTSPDVLDTALAYAECGWRILPLNSINSGACTCGKECNSPGKHPHVKGWTTAITLDPRKIKAWWHKWPTANVGIATGTISKLIVIDIDGAEGEQSWQQLITNAPEQVVTREVRTGRGRHLYFNYGDTFEIRNSASKIGLNLDVRADGGYVIAPPSIHFSGVRYSWTHENTPIAAAPHWLLDLLTAEDVEPLDDVVEGGRNSFLTSVAGTLRAQGLEVDQLTSELLKENYKSCKPPLCKEEVEAIAQSVCRYPAGERKFAPSTTNPLYWFKFLAKDWLSDPDIELMEDFQRGWLISLNASAWMKGGDLPDNRDQLFKLAKARSRKQFDAHCANVLSQFTPLQINGIGVLRHPFLYEWYQRTLKTLEAKVKGGKQSGVARTAKAQNEIQ